MKHIVVYSGVLFLFLVHTFSAAAIAEKTDSVIEQEDGLRWYDACELEVEGKGWNDTKSFYDRLPAKAEALVREPVWNLSHHSAGMCVRFVTDANEIRARWELRSKRLAMPHMAATGVSGLDLYVKSAGEKWKWLAVGRPTDFPVNSVTFVKDITKDMREYLLYFPLYNGVESIKLGVPEGAVFRKAPAYPKGRKPIVFYGTSITQGGCASRTGMVHTAILGRRFNYPVINLGFSGNGCMEPEMADLLAELDPFVYVLDCLPNMDGQMVAERVAPFVKKLRKAHPETPILLVEDSTYSDAFFIASRRQRNTENRRELHRVYSGLKSEGIENLYYLRGDKLLGDEIDNLATVDGSHPTDLGFMRLTDAFYEALKPILLNSEGV
ncbi:MAG: SGNH/GDSL hydrolase family protein [Sedimentisphaerales bacterium]|nr:SGNH/GDSL hydrolase family protein [Sedimentisphaerales bacterium]